MANVLAYCSGYGKFGHLMYEHLPTLGVRHLQIGAPKPDEIEAVQQRLRQHGLEALVLTARYLDEDTVATQEAAAAWTQAFDAAVKMGVGIVHSSVKAGTKSKQMVYDWLRRMGDEAAKRGVTLVLETHPDLLHKGDACLETMQAVNHPNVRINFDTGNISFYSDGLDAVTELKKCARFVASTHLKDHNGKFQERHFGTLGSGVVDFAGVLQVLRSVGYSGPWVVQIEGIQGEELTEEQVKERMTQSFAYLRQLGYAD